MLTSLENGTLTAQSVQVIIFSDNVFALKYFAQQMGCYYICGDVKAQERIIILDKFVTSKSCNIIFVSKVGTLRTRRVVGWRIRESAL